jgi:hypothetical protein
MLTYERTRRVELSQKTVQIPWTYDMHCPDSCFAYISAQKTETRGGGSDHVSSGNVGVAIYVDGRLRWHAASDSMYGIASAKWPNSLK